MAIKQETRKDGTIVHVVSFKYPDGQPSRKTFYSEQEAELFDAQWKAARAKGQDYHIQKPSTETLRDLTVEWAELSDRKPATIRAHLDVLNAHVISTNLAKLPAQKLTTLKVRKLKKRMMEEGRGEPTIRRTLFALQSVMKLAIDKKIVVENPVQPVEKPSGKRMTHARAADPLTMERVRAELKTERDRALVACLYIAGLRPGEARRLDVGDYRDGLLYVEDETKTDVIRPVEVFAPLAEDLDAYLATRDADPDEPLFPAERGGGIHMSEGSYRRWRRDRWRPAVKAVAAKHKEVPWIAEESPYLCRHTCASMLLRDPNWSVVEIADHLGNSPQMVHATYGHVIKALKGKPRMPIADQIYAGRRQFAEEIAKADNKIDNKRRERKKGSSRKPVRKAA